MFFITKARVICIFVVIRGEGHKLESFWWHPTHQWYIPPVRPFLTNLRAVSCISYKLTASFLDDVFTIFYNAYVIKMNLRLCGFNFAVIRLIILVSLVFIRITAYLRCHIENPSIEDTALRGIIDYSSVQQIRDLSKVTENKPNFNHFC